MKFDIVCNKNDEYYTPEYAITPLLKYLPFGSKIWCPFDTEDSRYVKLFKRLGFQVVNTHISTGEDFFTYPTPDVDYIISNPPYSVKGKVFKRLFEIGIPFAMLVGAVGIFESQERFNMFKDNDFELMYFNKRVAYLQSYEEIIPSSHPPFASIYVCKGILPKQVVFEEIKK
jgi:hypothetical protein